MQSLKKGKPHPPVNKPPAPAETKPQELTTEEQDNLQSLIQASEDKCNHSVRLHSLKQAHKTFSALEKSYYELMQRYRARDDIKKFEAQFKDFIKLFLPEQSKPWEACFENQGDLLKQYEVAIAEISLANAEIDGRYRHLDSYKEAMADVRTSQLDRDKIIQKFEDIQFKNKNPFTKGNAHRL